MKVEVDVLGSPSLTVLNIVSVDIKQHLVKKKKPWVLSRWDLHFGGEGGGGGGVGAVQGLGGGKMS